MFLHLLLASWTHLLLNVVSFINVFCFLVECLKPFLQCFSFNVWEAASLSGSAWTNSTVLILKNFINFYRPWLLTLIFKKKLIRWSLWVGGHVDEVLWSCGAFWVMNFKNTISSDSQLHVGTWRWCPTYHSMRIPLVMWNIFVLYLWHWPFKI